MWILFTLLVTLLVLSYYPGWRRRLTIKRWYTALDIDKHLTNYQQVSNDIDGFNLSRQARREHDAIEYTYGEIDFLSFIALISLAKPDQNTVFYDLGSGTGKAVVALAMVFNIEKSCGIELFNVLHTTALLQQQRLQQQTDYQDKANTLHFINEDFLHMDFSDATLIFINATAFFGETWLAINQCLLQVKGGTTVISTSKKLSAEAFTVTKKTTVKMSWGLVNAYIHQRLPSADVL